MRYFKTYFLLLSLSFCLLSLSAFSQELPKQKTIKKDSLSMQGPKPAEMQENNAPNQTATAAPAQQKQDTTVKKEKKPAAPIAFLTGLDIQFDYGKLHTLAFNDRSKWEGGAAITLKKYVSLVGQYGWASQTDTKAYKNADYTSKGYYYRAGVDFRLEILPQNFLMLGGRFGQSHFQDEIAYQIDNPIFNENSGTIARNNLDAYWWEFVVSSEKFLGKHFLLGFHFRLKNMNYYEDFATFPVYRIPGYGRTANGMNAEVNLYIKFRILGEHP